MRKITCKQMGGLCAVSFKEDSAREVLEQGLAHLKNSFDDEHKALYTKIIAMNPEDRQKWNEAFQKAWNDTVEE